MKKALSFALATAVLVAGFGFASVAGAQTSAVAGCTSSSGYSTINGASCNGMTTTSMSLLAGCSSLAGFSTATGAPCNGSSLASNGGTAYPAGCLSSYGYGVNGAPCNGAAGVGSNGVAYYLGGCTSNTGYSSINGLSCSTISSNSTAADGTVLIPGCFSTGGYSYITGEPCLIAGVTVTPPVAPGLPNTGEGALAPFDILVALLSLGLIGYGVTKLSSRA